MGSELVRQTRFQSIAQSWDVFSSRAGAPACMTIVEIVLFVSTFCNVILHVRWAQQGTALRVNCSFEVCLIQLEQVRE